MTTHERFSIVWKQVDQELSERFYVPGYRGFLPFLISGDSLVSLEAGDSVELTEWQLLAGIVYGLHEFDHDTQPWHNPEDRHTLTYLLDVLGNGFNFSDPEKMLLDVAFKLREANGHDVSRIALLTALELIPFSSKIRSDLICDTWAVASETDDRSILKPVPDLVMETTLNVLIHDAKEVICYYGLCAMILLHYDEKEIDGYLKDFVYPNIQLRRLKERIKSLLENPEDRTIRELLVT